MQERWAVVDEYLTDLFVGPDPALDAALRRSAAAGLPPHHVSALQGQFLHLLAVLTGARRILEVGALAGYSTIWLARALPPDGRLVTIEADAAHVDVARTNLAAAGVAALVDVRAGPALDVLPELAAGGETFDLVFLDADKPNNPHYLECALRLTRPGGVIVADNVVRDGAVAEADDSDASVAGVRRFLELVAEDRSLTATVVETVGSKGYDGFAIAVVTPGREPSSDPPPSDASDRSTERDA